MPTPKRLFKPPYHKHTTQKSLIKRYLLGIYDLKNPFGEISCRSLENIDVPCQLMEGPVQGGACTDRFTFTTSPAPSTVNQLTFKESRRPKKLRGLLECNRVNTLGMRIGEH